MYSISKNWDAKTYLTIMLRQQFILFYRFGHTYIPRNQLIEFDRIITNEVRKKLVAQFSITTPFEYEEEYVILHLEQSITNEDRLLCFNIEDVVSIYPMSLQAKVSIENKTDKRIRIEEPLFEDNLPEIESHIQRQEIVKAIDAVWKICNIEEDPEKYISEIGIDKIWRGLQFRKAGTKSFEIGEASFWEILVSYDRYEYFPGTTLGYFFDVGLVFANSMGFKTFEGSMLFSFLENIKISKPNMKFLDIIKQLESEETVQSYISKTSSNGVSQYFIAPLYLLLRDELRTSDDLNQTSLLRHLKFYKGFGENFKYSLVLLGGFFGFKKFYDVYYDKLSLRIFKTSKSSDTIIKSHKPKRKRMNGDPEDSKSEEACKKFGDREKLLESDLQHYIYKIIDNLLSKKFEVKLNEIVTEFNKSTGIKLTNIKLKEIVESNGQFECFKRGRFEFLKSSDGRLFS
jgi:hypothetical protein